MYKIEKLIPIHAISVFLCIFFPFMAFGQEEVFSNEADMEIMEDISGCNYRYISGNTIVANNVISSESDVNYTAKNLIKLTKGFKVEQSSHFKACIKDYDAVLELLKSSDAISIKDENTSEYFNLYPNVSKGIFYLAYNNGDRSKLVINVFNSSGRLIHSESVYQTGTVEIDISGFPKGLYILKSESDNKSFQRRLIIK